MSQHNPEFYNSRAWKTTRHAYKQSKRNLCERCLANGIIRPADVVHHKIPLTEENIKNLDLALGWDNLQALCTDCHALVHSGRLEERENRRYTIDSNGSVSVKK